MKNIISLFIKKASLKYLLVGLVLLISSLEGTIAKQNQKVRVRLRLEYFKNSTEERYLTIYVARREDRRYVPVDGVKIIFFLEKQSDLDMLGNVATDEDGNGMLPLQGRFYQAIDTLNVYNFIAVLKDDRNYRDAKRELAITDVFLKVDYIDQDTLKLIQATVIKKPSVGTEIKLKDVGVKFQVDRLFHPLTIGDEFADTDEDGKIITEFPLDLPGKGSNGQVIISVLIEDHDEFGNVKVSETLNWGLPTPSGNGEFPRTLWTPNAPLWMIITFVIMMLGVWVHFGWIVYNMIMISKEKTDVNNNLLICKN